MVRVSAIMSVRDGGRYIREAIDSMLGQTAPPDEIVVVDDGSEDESATIAASYGGTVRVIRQDRLGQGVAINAALKTIGGELITFLDSDDLWTDRKLELQRQALDSYPTLDIIFGHAEEFVSPELSAEERSRLRPAEGSVAAKLKGTMMIRTEAMRRAGPFGTRWQIAEFIDWYARAQENGLSERTLADVVLRRRLHLSNLGRRRKAARTEYATVMAERLRRRRARERGD